MPPPDWLSWEFWAKDSQGLYHLALIAAGVIGILLLAIRTFAANRSAAAALEQAKTAEQGHITDRFTKAVEQLGSDKLPVRVGAIYALERISRDSRRDYWPIMETLTADVREHAPWQGSIVGEAAGESTPAEKPENEAEQASTQVRTATDIQAILTVLGRRDEKARKQDEAAERCLDLTAIDLRGARLGRAHLEGANLRGAHLEDAHLAKAHLEGAFLTGANLQGADLGEIRSPFIGAKSAYLEHLEGADLWRAVGLTQEQLDMAFGDGR